MFIRFPRFQFEYRGSLTEKTSLLLQVVTVTFPCTITLHVCRKNTSRKNVIEELLSPTKLKLVLRTIKKNKRIFKIFFYLTCVWEKMQGAGENFKNDILYGRTLFRQNYLLNSLLEIFSHCDILTTIALSSEFRFVKSPH